ncbi:MAG TPA: hypothetical protein VN026_00830 [Bacteroidia bacterium]|jgi:hypothetical protein|nr:hypothetical protein [Bacteroidia bacterium]
MENETEKEKVIMTGSVPQCPYCKKPTIRTQSGMNTVTAMYYPPRYDENGNNINPDRNTRTSGWHCEGCGKDYATAGNYTEGFHYKK